MKKQLGAVAAVCLAIGLSGCFAGVAFVNRPVSGNIGLYADTQSNERVTENAVGAKSGESCQMSILGLITTGDATAAGAARAGGISKIASVDNRFTNILGIYARYCVVVAGE